MLLTLGLGGREKLALTLGKKKKKITFPPMCKGLKYLDLSLELRYEIGMMLGTQYLLIV